MEMDGWGKFREAVVGSEVEGLYRLLRGVTSWSHLFSSQPPLKQYCLVPSSTVSQPSPQEPTGPETLDPAGQAMVSASSAATPATEGDILAHMQPLRVQVGGAKHVYQSWVEGCKEGLSTSWATISAHVRKVHLGVGLMCPLCNRTFFNPDVLRHHRKMHN